jgi:nucleoside-diphosphate-sugar epimerase
MRYLVTGGAGFIGSHLVRELLGRSNEVVVLDDFSTGSRENLREVEDRITLVEGSVTDPAACAQAVSGVDYVLHQAAVPSVPRSMQDPVATHEASATGTLNVLVAARDAGVRRVVYAGSSSAYGNTPTLPKEEAMIPRPRSPYAVAKLTGESYCHAFHASYGLETVAVRYFNIFGPRQDPNSPYGAVIPKFIQAISRNEPPTIFGDGEQTRDFTYVANAIDANLLACDAPEAALGQVFNVGCGERISVNHLWEIIREEMGSTLRPIYREARAGDVRDSLASLDRSERILGYRPLVDLREGLRRTIAWHSTTATEQAA